MGANNEFNWTHYLSTVSYYRLSGYFKPFQQERDDINFNFIGENFHDFAVFHM